MTKKKINTNELIPAVRSILSTGDLVSCTFIPTGNLTGGVEKAIPGLDNLHELNGDTAEAVIEELKQRVSKLQSANQKDTAGQSKDRAHHPASEHQSTLALPSYLHVPGTGIICCAATRFEAGILHSNALRIANDQSPDPVEGPPATGRIKNRIAIVTGAAQGFGKGIAEDLFREGANIIIADLNDEAGKQLEKELNRNETANRTLFIQTNVADPASVKELVKQTVNAFGGVDIMISNAGILRAGGLDEMEPSTFELMTKVNYTGYFFCAKYAAEVMKVQTAHKTDLYNDIIQINSKSGLTGSKKNFAYAGGKFGGIGLTQSFALELMPDRIKVNSVCPGNFFDGPLWSDPETGLFVQYLNAGKVPGAKTVEDVKHFYEAQVPAGRGCEVKDVSRAILYSKACDHVPP
jgi:NAD(P)-dependent dehydrogenase (short-subunit alcohol dehydrogenase family)